jgi:large subunit ribosomal protein L18
MATRIRKRTSEKQQVRFKHKKRIRAKVEGTADKPRLLVYRSNANLYVQLVDDLKGHTLAAACTIEEELKGKASANLAGAKEIGKLIAKRALAKNITKVVFDRSGYIYHGKIKALADAAREAGLQF